MKLARIVGSALPGHIMGAIDYFRFPQWRGSWGGPFNGQLERQRIFSAIVDASGATTVIETGTFRGTTTEFMRSKVSRIVTIEGDLRNYGFSRTRFLASPNVTVLHGDSRERLLDVLDKKICGSLQPPLVIYLDAHWNEDLPLEAECEIVFSRQPDAIVMVDDFQVPGDPGYGYDDYGPGKALVPGYIEATCRRFDLVALYPTAPSSVETGKRRGCVVLAGRRRWSSTLEQTGLLRQRA